MGGRRSRSGHEQCAEIEADAMTMAPGYRFISCPLDGKYILFGPISSIIMTWPSSKLDKPRGAYQHMTNPFPWDRRYRMKNDSVS